MNRFGTKIVLLILGVIWLTRSAEQASCQVLARPELSREGTNSTDYQTRRATSSSPRDEDSWQTDPKTDVKRTWTSVTKLGAITYRSVDNQSLKCDVYLPSGEGPFPAVVAIHGGAWRNGTKFFMLRHAWDMAQAGYVVVAIDYRHAPEYPFPAQIHDCKYAVRWMRLNAEKYKIDPKRIAAFGYSAGGHLACLLGTTNPADGLEPELTGPIAKYDAKVSAVIAGGSPCEFSWIGDRSNVLSYWLGGRKCDNPSIYERASPTFYVTKDDPPFYLFHGEWDLVVPSSTSLQLHQCLVEKGVTSRHDIAKNLGHIATFSDLSWMKRGIAFLDSVLK